MRMEYDQLFSFFQFLSLELTELRIDLTDFDNNSAFAKYQTFKVLDESQKYMMAVGKYSEGDAGRYSALLLNLLCDKKFLQSKEFLKQK